MATKKISKGTPAAPVTAERANRLYRLLHLLGKKAQTRDFLAKQLRLGVRGFYRDLESLRTAAIDITVKDGCYLLNGKLADAVAKLPFPDPGLTLGEAQQLARGRSAAHRKLKQQLARIEKA
jgi:predicted DNA-binding transcriptional regulator YafY